MARFAAERVAPWRARRALAGLVLVALIVALQPLGAGAGVGWCRTDPTVVIDGRVGHITVLSHTEVLAQAKGPTRVRIEVPAGATTEVRSMDNGFGHGYDLEFVERQGRHGDAADGPVEIKVFVPVSGPQLPVVIDFEADEDGARSEAQGRTNKWVKLEVRF